MDLRHAGPTRVAAWEAEWTSRLEPAYRPRVERRRETQPHHAEFDLYDGDTLVGLIAVSHLSGEPLQVSLDDIWIEPEHRGKGHARAALAAAEEYAREQGAAALRLSFDPATPGSSALAAGYTVSAQHMSIELTGPKPLPDGVTAVTLEGTAYDEWRAASVREYAELNHANGMPGSLEDALESAEKDFGTLLPDGPATEGHTLVRLVAGDATVARLWVKTFFEPGTDFVFDVSSDPAHRGKGYGKAAMRQAENIAVADGAEHLKLNVHGSNTVAVSLYERLGYRTVFRFLAKDL